MAAELAGETCEEVARRLRVLGQPTRIELIIELAAGPRGVAEIAEAAGLDPAAASKHLCELQRASMVMRRKDWVSRRGGGSIDVTIELPAGSHVHGTAGSADFHCDGRLGDCRIKTGLGRITVERAATVSLKSGVGDIIVEHASEHAEVTAGSGDVCVRRLEAGAVIKNSNGDTWVGEAGGDLRLKAANGDIAVDVAHATVVAKAANGDVRLGEVMRGAVVLETQLGDLDVGIREGATAWLDLSATAGKVHNTLDATDAPEPSDETVEVRARTSVGEIAIRRARGPSDEQPTAKEQP